MTTVQKYPDDIENIIYEILAGASNGSQGMSISDIFQVIIQTRKIDIKPEVIYQFMQRMCKEGMAEKINENLYKGIKFDPEFPI
jgi:hypothetical protein